MKDFLFEYIFELKLEKINQAFSHVLGHHMALHEGGLAFVSTGCIGVGRKFTPRNLVCEALGMLTPMPTVYGDYLSSVAWNLLVSASIEMKRSQIRGLRNASFEGIGLEL